MVKTGDKLDEAAQKLAARLGGKAQVAFQADPKRREFDTISDLCIAQTKPAGFVVGPKFRDQAKATFEYAISTERQPYFYFEGPPDPGVIRKLDEYASRYGVGYVLDVRPL